MRNTENDGVLIIGYGNPLRGDDGVGWRAVEKLQGILREPWVHFLALHQLTPELAQPVADTGLVIFIDASVKDPPGSVGCRAIVPDDDDERIFTHSIIPDRLVSSARRPFGGAPRAFVYTIGGEFFGYREGLSDIAESGLNELLHRVEDLVAWWDGRRRGCTDLHPELAHHA
jgi:hydrogenase maturation protease